jgi:acetoin utilization protein AcuB
MLKSRPTVQEFMTRQVETVSGGKTLKDAITLMQARKIRHLPVTTNDQVVGIITDRDIKATLGLEGVDPAKSLVHYFCRDEVYTVAPSMFLDKVAETMAQKSYGSAVVLEDNKLVGIITMVDICKALSYIITQQFPSLS